METVNTAVITVVRELSPEQVEIEVEFEIVNENPDFYEEVVEYFQWLFDCLGYDMVGEEWLLVKVDDELR